MGLQHTLFLIFISICHQVISTQFIDVPTPLKRHIIIYVLCNAQSEEHLLTEMAKLNRVNKELHQVVTSEKAQATRYIQQKFPAKISRSAGLPTSLPAALRRTFHQMNGHQLLSMFSIPIIADL